MKGLIQRYFTRNKIWTIMEDKFNSGYIVFEDIYVNNNYNFWVTPNINIGYKVFLCTQKIKWDIQ